MRRHLASLMIAGALAVSPPQAFAMKSCDNEPAGNPKQALRTLDELEAFVPFVPPEEAAYFEKETGAAFQIMSAQRLQKLAQRPYYYAWKLHNAFDLARSYLKESNNLPEIVGVKMRIQFASRLPTHLSNASSAWDEFVWSRNLLTSEQAMQGSEKMAYLVAASGFYIWCLADLIVDNK